MMTMPNNTLMLVLLHLTLAFSMRVNAARVKPTSYGLDMAQTAEGTEVQELQRVVDDEPKVNDDRLQCLRQDDLDLVFPSSPEYVFRKVIGINGDNTGRDIYVTASGARIDKVDATLKITRVGNHNFKFEVAGTQNFGEDRNVACVDFFLEGVDVQTPSGVIDWIATIASNRDKLDKGQKGKLYFKLSGEGAAQCVSGESEDECKEWEVNLLHTKVEPFSFEITDQYILQEALTRAGGIDKIIMDNLWPAIKKAVPLSLAQSFRAMLPSELGVAVEADIQGVTDSAGVLVLNVDLTTNLDVVPASALKAFKQSKVNFGDIAEAKVIELLASDSAQELWANSREAFLAQLGHLGFLFNDDLKTAIMNAESIQDIKDKVIDAARKSADFLLQALEPFLKAKEEGKDGFFEGLELSWNANAGWSSDTQGLIAASLSSAESGNGTSGLRPLMTLPAGFMNAMNAQMAHPQEGGCEVSCEGFKFERGSLNLDRVGFRDFAVKSGDSEVADIYMMNGEASDMALTLPKSIDLGFKMSCSKAILEGNAAGDMTFSVTESGLQVIQAPGDEVLPEVNGKVRKGPGNMIDGALSAEFSRPTTALATFDITALAPSADANIMFKVEGHGHRLEATVQATASMKLNVFDTLQHFLAPRPQEDFGYVFWTGKFVRIVKDGESNIPKESTVVAVVSCGFLRLLEQTADRDSLKRVNMKPSGGQLQIDLTEYYQAPNKVSNPMNQYHECIDLYSSGQSARTHGTFFSTRVGETLCGDGGQIDKLREAIALQVQRFKDEEDTHGNYGTHEVGKPQYVLPSPNTGTKNLTKIVTELRQNQNALLETKAEARKLSTPASLIEKKKDLLMEKTNKSEFWGMTKKHPVSMDRQNCKARDDMDKVIFPPEQFADKCVRMAIGGVPTIGELFLVLDKIQVAELDLLVKVQRTSDDLFRVEIMGSSDKGSKNDNGKDGHIDAWVEGLDFVAPQSSLDSIASGISNVENVFWQVITLGMGSKEHGRLDRGKVLMKLNLKSEFKHKIDEEGNDAWEVVSERANKPEIKMDIKFGTGGIVNSLVNNIIKDSGGVDQIFFDMVFPLITKLIPARLGDAFDAVPMTDGQLTHTFKITGRCESVTKHRCPAEELLVDIQDVTELIAKPEPILTKFIASKDDDTGCLVADCKLLGNVLDAYKGDADVFKGSKVKADVDAFLDLAAANSMQINTQAAASLPMPLLQSMVGPESPIIDFLPKQGALVAESSADLSKGIITLPLTKVQNLKLPIVIGDGTESLKLSANLEGMSVTLVKHLVSKNDRWEEVVASEPSLIFDKDTPLTIRVPELKTSLDRTSGITLAVPQDIGAYFTRAYVQDALTAATASLAQPINVRTGAVNTADGAVPNKFIRPASRMTGKLDLSHVIMAAHASAGITLTGSANEEGEERVVANLDLSASVTLKLDNTFWRGLLDVKDKDWGYINFAVAGRYGEPEEELDSGKSVIKILPEDKALVMLSCGTLDIYRANKGDDKFEKVLISVDLAGAHSDDNQVNQFKTGLHHIAGSSTTCLLMTEKEGSFWSSAKKKYICGNEEEIVALHEAVNLQRARFTNVARAIAANPTAIKDRKASPDGTWFVEQDPKDITTWQPEQSAPASAADVMSPGTLWARAKDTSLERREGDNVEFPSLRAAR